MSEATAMPTKTCIDCGEEKPEEQFRANTIYGGKKSTCRSCMAEKARGNGGGGHRGSYIDQDVQESTTRKERHRIAGEDPLNAAEKRAVDEAARNMISDKHAGKWERTPEPMAPITQLLKKGMITEPRMWVLCDAALREKERLIEKEDG